MRVDKCSSTQSFKANTIEELDEMITEWAMRHDRMITNIALLIVPQYTSKAIKQGLDYETQIVVSGYHREAIVTYTITEDLKPSTSL